MPMIALKKSGRCNELNKENNTHNKLNNLTSEIAFRFL